MSINPVSTLTKVFKVASRGDMGFETPKLLVAADQTIKKYDVLVYSTGKLAQAIALPGTNSTLGASGGSLGDMFIAMEDKTTTGTVTQSDKIAVVRFDRLVKVLMRIVHATASSSELQDVVLGTAYQLGRYRASSATDWFYCMTTVTTNGELKLLERSLDSDEADDYGLGWYGI